MWGFVLRGCGGGCGGCGMVGGGVWDGVFGGTLGGGGGVEVKMGELCRGLGERGRVVNQSLM
eukprot:COSAG05_NODE_21187_length_274_cov_0.434286_1_plen_61_part_01